MKGVLYTLSALSIAALVMLTPAVGWSRIGGSGGMMGGSDAGMMSSGQGMMGGSIMNNGQMSNQNAMQNGTGMSGTIDTLMKRIGRLLDQRSENGRANGNNRTAMNSRSSWTRDLPEKGNSTGRGLESINR